MNENKKVNSSIVFKLNSWHVSRLLSAFLWIDVMITVLFFGAAFYHAELTLSQMAQTPPPHETFTAEAPGGIMVPKALQTVFFPESTKDAVRRLLPGPADSTFLEYIAGIRYELWIPYQDGYYRLEYQFGAVIGLFLKLFIVLLILQVLSVIGEIGKGIRAMRRALKPIEALTETAKSISAGRGMSPAAQLRDLAGTLETINATRLDRRVPVGIVQDELKDLAGAINGMLDRINEAYRSQVRFVSDASHELRTPIAVIQGYANLLDRWGKNDPKALQESIDAIKSESENMKDLVEQLLFLARGDNNTMQMNMESFCLSELLEEIVRETQMIDQTHTISSEIEEDIYVTGDIQLVKQAIRIFADNSIKYSPADEDISVRLRGDGAYGKITVQDNGIGIPAEDLPFVFDRFFRSDDSRARKTGGTGLGLSIAKWIIDRHDGNVEIISRKDLGTRINILLRLSKPDTTDNAATESPQGTA